MENQLELMIKINIDAWKNENNRTNSLLSELTDEQIQKEVSPGRNTGTYLLGHLTAVHDALFPLLGIGEKLYPHLTETFIKNADNPAIKEASIKDLRNYWDVVNQKLSQHMNRYTPEEWLQKHTSVSEEDFKKEPHRNRMNVLISRTNHLSYHRGQLVFLKGK